MWGIEGGWVTKGSQPRHNIFLVNIIHYWTEYCRKYKKFTHSFTEAKKLPNFAAIQSCNLVMKMTKMLEKTGSWFKIKMPNYRYRDSHKNKMVSWPSLSYDGNPHSRKDGLYIETGIYLDHCNPKQQTNAIAIGGGWGTSLGAHFNIKTVLTV